MAKRVAVIGAGVSGLAATKCCIAEGFDVVCFEKTDDIGGLWNYREDAPENQSTVMKSTVMNTSKELMTFSDFPPREELPNFMHNTQLNQYLREYATNFNLYNYIQFRTEVTAVKQAESYIDTGKWYVTTNRSGTSEFDAVIVCSGHHSMPHVPHIHGLEKFEGSILHSQRYRHWKGYEDKRVLIVGFGNSALDVAVELSRVAKKTIISTRSGGWVFRRVCYWGYPFDMMFLSRCLEKVKKTVSPEFLDLVFQNHANLFVDHDAYGLTPKHGFMAQHPSINDQLPDCLARGAIIIKPNTADFGANIVVFDDGTMEEIDTVILCTGYDISFPFLDQQTSPVHENQVNNYLHIFPLDMPHPTLAFVGLIQPIGALAPISELQSRWICQIFSKEKTLPSQEIMKGEVEAANEKIRQQYTNSRRHTIQVDYIDYMVTLAKNIGCEPDLKKLFWNDFPLFLQCFFGPSTPYLYRLQGPGSIPQARDIVLTTSERMHKPFTVNRRTAAHLKQRRLWVRLLAFLWVILFFIVWPILTKCVRTTCEQSRMVVKKTVHVVKPKRMTA